ncbi:MAG: phosphate ABC transporter substrate-binding protein PstS [Candidatus Saccharibacteria bacterium]|nr:phosphate ABC transporter substrate-binding protein PstS [Microbacteriaceae bacterium]
MTPRTRLIRLISILFAVTIFAGAATTGTGQAAEAATTYTPISGTGSTWSQNALDQWRRNVASNYGMTVNYSGTGSSAGRKDFIGGTVDFAVSEIPFQSAPEDGSAPEKPANGYAYMPIVAGGTSFMYNLKIGGKQVSNLRLGGDTITKIFTNTITNWNDPLIQADNPGLAMPNKPIVPVVRSDGSGSTAQFTLWMSKQYPALWSAFSGRSGLTSQYPVKGSAKAQSGSLGVAGYVSQNYGEGAITYVEYSYALKSGFPVAKVLNAAGYYIEPTAPSVAVALLQAAINPTDLTQILDGVYSNPDKRTYPLSSYSYMIVPTAVAGIFTAKKGVTLSTFASYMLCEGQQQAAALGYSPLPLNLVTAGFQQIARIPGSVATSGDLSKCNNPTFDPANPGSNKLASSAPQPAACDQKGPNQCTTGPAGAAGVSTAVTGSGTGGSASGAAQTPGADAAGAGTVGTAATTGDTPVYDANGALVSGGSTSRANAVSTPFTLASSEFGGSQAIMLAAGLLLVLAILLPPLLSRRLKR